MRQLIAGNWKMHGLDSSLAEVDKLRNALAENVPIADVLLCPPATLISRVAKAAGALIQIGAQDCHPDDFGAHTGDISAPMLKDAGASAVILGHSERRRDHGETSKEIAAKVNAARRALLFSVICVGESEEERAEGSALKACATALAESIPDGLTPSEFAVAYEPVWAIGSGRTPTVDEIAQMHAHVRECLSRHFGAANASNTRILYGGSVNPGNASRLLAIRGVDGVLVGGASLKAGDFFAIVSSAAR